MNVLGLAALLEVIRIGAEFCAGGETIERVIDRCAMLVKAIAADLDVAAAVALEPRRAR